MRTAFWISGAFLLVFPVVASAQWLGVRVPPGYGSTYHHASTVEEGWQRGRADIIRSAGLKNLLDSEAQINWEEARKRAYDNHVYGIQKYFEGRALNRQYRAVERGPRPTEQDLYRYAAARKPDRLSNEQLDPVMGAVSWPPGLLGPEFEADRAELERLFAQRAIAGFLAGQELTAVRMHIQSMVATLKSQVRSLPPQTYVESKNFLESLSYESLLAPG
jgi:hypothetical protein